MKKLFHCGVTTLFIMLCPILLLTFAKAMNCEKCGSPMVTAAADRPAAPSCEKPGKELYYCTRCQNSAAAEIAALGHDYEVRVERQPTCTAAGYGDFICTRCQSSYEGDIPALGHSYQRETREATCTEEGITHLHCVRCGYETDRDPVEALGHDFEVTEDREATCTEDGVHTATCARCCEEQSEVLPAPGHCFSEMVEEPTCTESGARLGSCTVCGETLSEPIEPLGHAFGEWETVEEPTLFKTGKARRVCERCGGEESETLEKKKLRDVPALIAAGIGAVLGGSGAVWYTLRGAGKAAKAAETAAAAESGAGMITLKMNSVMLCLDSSEESRALEETLKNRPYIDVKKPEESTEGPAAEGEKAERPALVLFNAADTEELTARLAEYSAKYEKAKLGAVVSEIIPEETLAALKEEKRLFTYARSTESAERKLVRLVLPLYKPAEASGNYAENATLITDALGLPLLSALLNIYVVGGDVAEAMKNRSLGGTADIADMINDVAGLFGIDGIADFAEAVRVGADQKERLSDKKKAKQTQSAE